MRPIARTPAFLAFLLLLGALPAQPIGAAEPFVQGSTRATLIVGSGRAFDENYLVIGAGLAYYLVNGLEAGIDVESWTGADPGILKLSPQLRYVLPLEGPVRPYAGAFYRLTQIEDYEDLESAGYRAGVYLLAGGGTYFGIGVVQERYLECDESVFVSCDETYTEAVLSFAIR